MFGGESTNTIMKIAKAEPYFWWTNTIMNIFLVENHKKNQEKYQGGPIFFAKNQEN